MAKSKQQTENGQQEQEQENAPAKSNQVQNPDSPMPILQGDNYRVGAEGVTNPDTGEVMTLDQIGQQLNSAEQGMELTSEYYEFPEGEEKRILYVGDTFIKGQGGVEVPAVRFYIADEQKFCINASAVLVSTLQQHPKMTPWSVYNKGKTRSKQGFEYYDYSIRELVTGKGGKK